MTDPNRLPRSMVPENYRLHLTPDLEAGTFSGTVTIVGSVAEDSPELVLNNDGLAIAEASVNGKICDTSVDAETERLTLHTPVAAGPAEISISFSGTFNDHLVGFYLSNFTNDQGEEVALATTQFEATHARKAFPCWDEPEYKAIFEISITCSSDHQAVANSAEVGRTEEDENGNVTVTFAPTMIMSTYLVAFVIGPLEFSETIDVDGVPLRVVHVPGKEDLDELALESAAFALRYFTEYFGIPYPGDKVDLIAIPDFAFGAMENLGCITFREALLLLDPKTATQPEMQRAADVIHHELAHMWFGDLVTMKWWNGLWLNEAFATFMEMRCTDAFRPEWERWTDFGLSRTAALLTDGLASTRPIEFEVKSPEEAEGMFDILTYEKGAAVVRMLEQHIGEEPFKQGIRRYMNQHAYGNAETTDLWDAIEEETGEPVRRIMDSWIFQGGFPLIDVTFNPGGTSVTVSQSRFTYAGSDTAGQTTWAVPLRIRSGTSEASSTGTGSDQPAVTHRILLEADPVTVDLGAAADWVVINAEGASFVRVAYPEELLEELAAVGSFELSALERYALIDDTWAAVQADRATAGGFLSLLEAMAADTDRSVWQRIISGFSDLERLVEPDAEQAFADIAHDAFAPALANLGLTPHETDDERTRQRRGDLVRAMGVIALDPEVQDEAKRTVSVGRRDSSLVDPPLMAAALDVAAHIGDDVDFEDTLQEWKSATTPQVELRNLYSLADFPGKHHLERTRQLVLDGEVRSQNAPFLLRKALTHKLAGWATWEFIVENWDFLLNAFASSSIVRMLEGITTLNEPHQVAAIEAFFADHPVPQGAKTLEQILERLRVSAGLREREAANFSNLVRSAS